MSGAKLVVIIQIVSILAVFSGCDFLSSSPEDEIGNAESDHFIAIAGLSTMSFLDLRLEQTVSVNLSLGLGVNWIGETDERIYVINSLSNNLQIFQKGGSLESTYLYDTIDLGIQENNNPYSACFSDESTMYVTNLMQNTVSVLYVGGVSRIDTTWQVGQAPEGILYRNNHVYVVNSGYDFSAGLNGHRKGSIYKIDAFTGVVVDSIQVGMNPQHIEASRGGLIHVACTGDYGENTGEIWVMDTDLEVLNRVSVDAYPGKIYFNDIYCYVACGGWESDGDSHGLILAYEFQTPEDMHYIEVDLGAIDITDGYAYPSTAYVACFDALSICAVKDDEVLATYALNEPPVAVSKIQLF